MAEAAVVLSIKFCANPLWHFLSLITCSCRLVIVHSQRLSAADSAHTVLALSHQHTQNRSQRSLKVVQIFFKQDWGINLTAMQYSQVLKGEEGNRNLQWSGEISLVWTGSWSVNFAALNFEFRLSGGRHELKISDTTQSGPVENIPETKET